MESIRTISCKLTLLPQHKRHIEATLSAFSDARSFVADYGRTHRITRQFYLHHACYKEVRRRFGLSANLAVRAIARVAPRLLKAKTRGSTFKPTSIDYDVRIFSFRELDWTVSLTLLNTRERLALEVGDWQRQALAGRLPTSATLTKKGKGYFLDIQIKELVPDPSTPTKTLGVDVGIKKVATLSSGESFGGAALNSYRLKRHRVRKSLQSKADKGKPCTRKNARRVLKRLSGKEYRYQTGINHQISKQIVEQAKATGSAIVLEDLKGIRDRTTSRLRKSQRGLHNSWAFYQLRAFIEYKARRAGVRVILIDPPYTSQTCSSCLHIGLRQGEFFSCTNCGSAMDADLNASLNIAAVGAVVILPGNPPFSCPLPMHMRVAEAAG